MPKPIPTARLKSVPEIKWDPSSRKEYLTGFHKRKLQRQKHYEEKQAKIAKEEKTAIRQMKRETFKEFIQSVKDIEGVSDEEDQKVVTFENGEGLISVTTTVPILQVESLPQQAISSKIPVKKHTSIPSSKSKFYKKNKQPTKKKSPYANRKSR